MKELQYITNIFVEINNKNLEIKFICNEKINKNELEEFYLWKKFLKQ